MNRRGVVLTSAGARLASGAAVVAFAMVACRSTEDPRRVVMRSDGALCLGAAPESDGGEGGVAAGVDLVPGKPLVIGVRSACLSNLCATARAAKCSVKREGQRLLVTSELSWLGPQDLGDRCPSDCTYLESRCETDPLGAGTYAVTLGDRTIDVTLPSHLDVRCDRDRRPVSKLDLPEPPPPPPPVVTATPPVSVAPSAIPAAPGTGVVATPPPGDIVCLGPAVANKTRALRTGQPLAVTLLHKNPCTSLSCTKAPGKCTIKRKGFDITVTPTFPAPTAKPSQPCTEECSAIAATCRTDGLPAGTYTLHIGAQTKEVTIPSSSAPDCAP